MDVHVFDIVMSIKLRSVKKIKCANKGVRDVRLWMNHQIFHFFLLTRMNLAFFPQIEQFDVEAKLVMGKNNYTVDINDHK